MTNNCFKSKLSVYAILLLSLLLSFQILYSDVGMAGMSEASLVLMAAKRDLPTFFNNLRPDAKIRLGLDNDTTLDKIKFGKPYQMNIIQPNSLESISESGNVDLLLEESSQWYIPIKINNQIRSLCIVDKVKDEWKLVSIGHKPLATEVSKVIKAWPSSKGYTIKLAVSYQTKTVFFTVEQMGRKNLTPLLINKGKKYEHYKNIKEFKDTVKEYKARLNNLDQK